MNALINNHWQNLRQFTRARIALGRAGSALPTSVNLQFQLDHARARDAVHLPLQVEVLKDALQSLHPAILVANSQARSRSEYLQRPDLGRLLAPADRTALAAHCDNYDIAIIVADGLSARAVQEHSVGVLGLLVPALKQAGLALAPLVIAREGRVAIGDEIGQALGAKLSLVLIGERPGLSSPDSLGIYLTYDPAPGRSDAQRNCISNIRPPEGQGYPQAVDTCLYLCRHALQRQLSGVALKDDSATLEQSPAVHIPFFP